MKNPSGEIHRGIPVNRLLEEFPGRNFLNNSKEEILKKNLKCNPIGFFKMIPAKALLNGFLRKKTHAGNPEKKPRRISEEELLEESPQQLSGEFPEKKTS